MRGRVALLLLAVFFIGFPLVGVAIFWVDGHKNVEKSAIAFASETVVPALEREDASTLTSYLARTAPSPFDAAALASVKDKYGKVESVNSVKAVGSNAWRKVEEVVGGVPIMSTYHYAKLRAKLQCSKGPAELDLVLRRKVEDAVHEVDDKAKQRPLERGWQIESYEFKSFAGG